MKLNYPVMGGQYKITQNFGENPDGQPDYYLKWGYDGHNGIDFAGTKDDNIYAAASGKVTYAQWNRTGYGNLIIIEDEEGGQHYYGHLSSFAVKVGDAVIANRFIGSMGNTGNVIGNEYSDGTHLHYGYRPKDYDKSNGYGGFIDPAPYFEDDVIPVMTAPESSAGWSEIICEGGANLRSGSNLNYIVTWLPQGVKVYRTGEAKQELGLVWEKVKGDYWIARADSFGTVILGETNE